MKIKLLLMHDLFVIGGKRPSRLGEMSNVESRYLHLERIAEGLRYEGRLNGYRREHCCGKRLKGEKSLRGWADKVNC